MADTWLFKMCLWKKCFDNWFTKNHTKFYLNLKKVLKSTFFKPWLAGNQTSKTLNFFYKVNKHIPVLDIAKNKSLLISGLQKFDPEKSAMWSEFYSK